MSTPISNALEAGFASTLQGLLGGYTTDQFPVLQGGQMTERVAPYSVCSCDSVEEAAPLSGFYTFEMRVQSVSNIDDSDSSAHQARTEALRQAIDGVARYSKDDDSGTQLLGFYLVKGETFVDEQNLIDVYTLTGCVKFI
jgi:hypothetical protein